MIIDSRYSGIPDIAHGGYVGGMMARALLRASVEVRLRRPVPVGRHVDLVPGKRAWLELRDEDTVLAEALPVELRLDIPEPVSLADASAASAAYPGAEGHFFGNCFCCGPQRAGGDGLRIRPGAIPGRDVVAGFWIPDAYDADIAGNVLPEIVWASLDCPQLWALIHDAPADSDDRVVTGDMATRLIRPVVAGEPHVVMAWPMGRDERRLRAGAAVIGPDGDVCAVSRQTAVVTDWGVPLGLDHWRRAATRPHLPLAA